MFPVRFEHPLSVKNVFISYKTLKKSLMFCYPPEVWDSPQCQLQNELELGTLGLLTKAAYKISDRNLNISLSYLKLKEMNKIMSIYLNFIPLGGGAGVLDSAKNVLGTRRKAQRSCLPNFTAIS